MEFPMFCVYMIKVPSSEKIPQAEPVGKKLCGLGRTNREAMRHC